MIDKTIQNVFRFVTISKELHFCKSCNKFKDNSEFYKNNSKPSLLNSECKDCVRQKRQNRISRTKTKSKYQVCSTCNQKMKIEFFRNDRYEKTGKSKQCKFCKAAKHHNNRTIVGSLTGKQLFKLWNVQNGICAYSGRKITINNANLEHIKPVKFGGKSNIKNVVYVDEKINHLKLNHSLKTFCMLMEYDYLKIIKNIKKIHQKVLE